MSSGADRRADNRIMTSQRVLDWTQEMAEDDEWDSLVMSSQVVLDY